MKRKASDDEDNESLSKMSKKAPETVRPVSGRKKKPPAWMSSFVTGKSKPDAEIDKKSKNKDKETITKAKVKSSKIAKKPPVKQSAVKTKRSDTNIDEESRKDNISSLALKPKTVTKVLSVSEIIAQLSDSPEKEENLPNDVDVLLNKPILTNASIEPLSSTAIPSTEISFSSEESYDPHTENTIAAVPATNGFSGEVPSEKPSMIEVVLCISTSSAMKDYLSDLKESIRETVWRLQSLIPNLRIGVLAHSQGGIYDDKPSDSSSSPPDHSYIRSSGHSGTKWLDLGATMSQLCAFVDSLGK